VRLSVRVFIPRLAGMLLFGLILAGCGGKLVKPGATAQDLARDEAACNQQYKPLMDQSEVARRDRAYWFNEMLGSRPNTAHYINAERNWDAASREQDRKQREYQHEAYQCVKRKGWVFQRD